MPAMPRETEIKLKKGGLYKSICEESKRMNKLDFRGSQPTVSITLKKSIQKSRNGIIDQSTFKSMTATSVGQMEENEKYGPMHMFPCDMKVFQVKRPSNLLIPDGSSSVQSHDESTTEDKS